ncbi:hypothetical protein M752DRAFT_284447 [Aspergillus phoenicis ATCC 13157]|uniref:Uncharacterized protein n=1 Tax=Aspergillus phoenicis ATCC 13157 TaxID=1353007 RepID=A0A370PHP1_ASPPH|nr:hypothetical protein M752DRAFT_284447 [Aspergillus phoenicis ATCC 13157]
MKAISGGTSILNHETTGFDTLKAQLSRMQESRQFSDLLSPSFDKAANKTKSRVVYIPGDHFIVSRIFDFVYRAARIEDISKRKLNSNLKKDWDDCGSLAIGSDVYKSQCPPRSDLQEILIRFALPHLGTLKGSRQSDKVRKDHSEFVYEVSTALIESIIKLEKRPW